MKVVYALPRFIAREVGSQFAIQEQRFQDLGIRAVASLARETMGEARFLAGRKLFVNVPERPQQFVGRKEPLRLLEERLVAGGMGWLWGIGGTGKTSLALEYAYRCQIEPSERRSPPPRYPDGVYFMRADDRETAVRALAELIEAETKVRPALLTDAAARAELESFFAPKRALLIVDNADEQAERLLSPIPQNMKTATLITSRAGPSELLSDMRDLQISSLDEGEVELLISGGGKLPRARRSQDTKRLLELTGGHPQCIEIILQQWRSSPERSLDELLEKLPPVLDLKVPNQEKTVGELLGWSLRKAGRGTRAFFFALGACGGYGFTVEAAAATATAGGGLDRVRESLSRLQKLSLVQQIDSQPQRWRLHPVLLKLARSGGNPANARAADQRHATYWVNFAQRHDTSGILGSDEEIARWNALEAEVDGIMAAWDRLLEEAMASPKPRAKVARESAAAIGAAVCKAFCSRGYWRTTLKRLEASLAYATHPNEYSTMATHLAHHYRHLGEFEKDLELCSKALERARRKGGPLLIANALNEMARACRTGKKYEDARGYSEETLTVCSGAVGGLNPEVDRAWRRAYAAALGDLAAASVESACVEPVVGLASRSTEVAEVLDDKLLRCMSLCVLSDGHTRGGNVLHGLYAGLRAYKLATVELSHAMHTAVSASRVGDALVQLAELEESAEEGRRFALAAFIVARECCLRLGTREFLREFGCVDPENRIALLEAAGAARQQSNAGNGKGEESGAGQPAEARKLMDELAVRLESLDSPPVPQGFQPIEQDAVFAGAEGLKVLQGWRARAEKGGGRSSNASWDSREAQTWVRRLLGRSAIGRAIVAQPVRRRAHPIFVSRAEEDDASFEELAAVMRSFGLEVITGKHGHIPTGTDWDAWILETIGRARLAVALVSIKFFASRYITERELPWLLERAERNELKLSWILVRPAKFELPVAMKLKGMQSVWGSTQQCLPQKKGAARDKAWLQIAQELTKDA